MIGAEPLIPTLVVGGVRAKAYRRIATNLRRKGFEVKWHWESEGKRLPNQPPPAGCGAVVVLKDLIPHSSNLKEHLKKCGLPVVWTVKHWAVMSRDLKGLLRDVSNNPLVISSMTAPVEVKAEKVHVAPPAPLVKGEEMDKMESVTSVVDLAAMSGVSPGILRQQALKLGVLKEQGGLAVVPDAYLDAVAKSPLGWKHQGAGERAKVQREIAGIVRAARESRGWSQTALAKQVENLGLRCKQCEVSRVERGKGSSVEMVLAVGKVLGVDLPTKGLLMHGGGRQTPERVKKAKTRFKVAPVEPVKPTTPPKKEVAPVEKEPAPAPVKKLDRYLRKEDLLNTLKGVVRELLRDHDTKEIRITDEGIEIVPRNEVVRIAF